MKTQHLRLALTDPPQEVRLEAGVGNFYVGPDPQRASVPHIKVAPNAPIDWSALSEVPQRGAYAWPRWIDYRGNDLSIFQWAEQRPIERLVWTPTKRLRVDASRSQISGLEVHVPKSGLSLCLPAQTRLVITGHSSKLSLSHSARGAGISVSFREQERGSQPRFYRGLRSLSHLEVSCSGVRSQSVSAITKYKELTSLSLSGRLHDLEMLARLKKLQTIDLHSIWNFDHFPPLESWPQLQKLLAHNLPKEKGGALRKQTKGLPHLEATVSGLRSPEWIHKNAASLFREWAEAKKAKAEEALTSFAAAAAQSALKAVNAYAAAFNRLHQESGLDTAEREDAVDALYTTLEMLGQREHIEEALERFDGLRDF